MFQITLYVFTLLTLCHADVLRTVICKNQCNDYLHVPESSMPLCSDIHLKMNECGTVITCGWAEAERDKVRPVANTTDIVCCYRTVIKEKGDCDVHTPEVKPIEVQMASHACVENWLPWLIASILLMIVVVQSAVIIWTCIQRPGNQKVQQAPMIEVQCSRRPIYMARPLIDASMVA
ncbi:unnamed protein product [Auanema sp. JU1783]|nr:unnamed protein product [Auanema sp. JU1783]